MQVVLRIQQAGQHVPRPHAITARHLHCHCWEQDRVGHRNAVPFGISIPGGFHH